ncbi:MAG: hypothetical protein JKY51_05580 [Opitutaceae bacterium]|nr:hypothetical protein [Opitutaceae bacterium]
MRISAPEAIEGEQFERTVSLIDHSEEDAYMIDIFRIIGGSDHARFLHSYAGELTTEGLNLEEAEEYGHETLMRHFRCDKNPPSGWSADWKIDNELAEIPPESDIHLRTIDVTTGAVAYTAEAWVTTGFREIKTQELWIPRLMTRRQGTAPLHSTFVSLIEPYEGTSKIKAIKRLTLEEEDGTPCSDSQVAVEIELISGQRDLLIALDSHKRPTSVHQPDWDVDLSADLCWVRRDVNDQLKKVTLTKGTLKIGDFTLETDSEFIEKSL